MKPRLLNYTAAEVPFIYIDVSKLTAKDFAAWVDRFAKDAEQETGAFVYFMLCDSPDQQIKIGFAADPGKRLRGAQTDSPYPLRILATFRAGDWRAVESLLHERFKSLRIRGEWFRSSPELLEYIAAIGAM